MAEFKVGDKVRCTRRDAYGSAVVEPGIILTVSLLYGDDFKYFRAPFGNEPNGLWFVDHFELVEEPSAEAPRGFQVGDMVIVGGEYGKRFKAPAKVVAVPDVFSAIVEHAEGWRESRYGTGRYWHVEAADITLVPAAPEETLEAFKAAILETLREAGNLAMQEHGDCTEAARFALRTMLEKHFGVRARFHETHTFSLEYHPAE